MNPFVITLVLISTVMHAGWNLLARGRRNEAAFFRRMLLVSVIVGLVPAVVSEVLANSISTTAWLCMIGSGVCCGVYYFALARAYGASDFTVVYPVARALPVILVGLGDVLRGNLLTAAGWGGMILVVGGCALCPLHSFRELSLRRYATRALGYVLLTALATVGYTLFDKVASESLVQSPATALRYCYFFFVASWLFYETLLRLLGGAEGGDRVGWRLPALAGVLNFGAYGLVLWAYQLTRRAGYIVAFRQFSIVIGVVLAFAIYREKSFVVRLTGALLATGGLIVIGLWGG